VRACGWIFDLFVLDLAFCLFLLGNLLPFVGLRGCYPFLVDNSDL
jgi:hypothetical protein